MTDPRRVAKHDPATAIAPLFRPLQKSRAARPKLDIRQEFNQTTIWYRGPDALGVCDQTVLFAVLYLSQRNGRELLPSTDGRYTRQALQDLLPVSGGYAPRTVYVDTTLYAILQVANMADDGRSYAQVRECIDRLAAVTVFVNRHGVSTPPMRLLSRIIKDDGHIKIALNERLAMAFAHQYVEVDLEERQLLHTDAAKILHAYLSATLRRGGMFKYTVDTLAFHIYGENNPKKDLRRKRRERTREALKSISQLPGWAASMSNGIAYVSRGSGEGSTGTP